VSATIEDVLAKYIPQEAIAVCTRWIVSRNIHLKISAVRTTKLGDYRPLERGKGHRITVNHDLNPYSFLITFTHEVAHLHSFLKYGAYHDPHGREWKQEFKVLMGHFLAMRIFPEELEMVLQRHLDNPPSSSCHDPELMKALKLYDPPSEIRVYHLEELPHGSRFRLHGEKSRLSFTKGLKNRTRFRCTELESGRDYLVSAIAEVVLLDDKIGVE
jgi:SprT protein